MSDEPRSWSIAYYLSTVSQGYSIIFQETRVSLARLYRCLRANSNDGANNNTEKDNQSTSILYGAHILARLAATGGLYIPAFLLDIRHGTEPTRKFVAFSYFTVLFGLVSGISLTKLVVDPSMKQILPGLIDRVHRLFGFLVTTVEIVYISFGMFNLAYVVYVRQNIRDFFLTHGNVLRLPRWCQRQITFHVFYTTLLFSLLAEPMFALFALSREIRQPYYWPNVDPTQFMILKSIIIISISCSSTVISFLSTLGALSTRFLITLTATHLEFAFDRQLIRLNKGGLYTGELRREQLTSLVDKSTSSLMADYACDTLTMDWPELTPEDSKKLEGQSSTSRRQGLDWPTSSSGGLSFLYKNLVKNLSELSQMIEIHEQNFGLFHVALICINGLIVAQWVVIGLTQARLIGSKIDKGEQVDGVLVTINGVHLTPFAIRTAIGVCIFFVSNALVFLSCDCLSSRLNKMKSQLFKINVESAVFGLSKLNRKAPVEAKTRRLKGDDMELVWCLYDQFVRMANKTNFRLTSNTYYNKNCILLIFGREISLILLYIQMIDIYTYVL